MAQFMAQLAKLVRVSPGVGAAFPLNPEKTGWSPGGCASEAEW